MTYFLKQDRQTYYFKNLRTIDGKPLPKFESPPYILAFSNEGAVVEVTSVGKDSLNMTILSYSSYEGIKSKYKIILLIASRPIHL